jgi:hypothetical protein
VKLNKALCFFEFLEENVIVFLFFPKLTVPEKKMKLSISQKMYLLVLPTLAMGLVVGALSWQSLKNGTRELKKANLLSEQAILSQLYVAQMSDGRKLSKLL